MQTAASISVSNTIANGVSLMLADPYRVARAVYADWMLIPEGKSLVEMLSDCSQYLRAQEAHGRAGRTQYYDFNRLIALRQAEDALLALILADEPAIPTSIAA